VKNQLHAVVRIKYCMRLVLGVIMWCDWWYTIILMSLII